MLIVLAPMPGNCYTNTVAQKINDDLSPWDSTVQIGLTQETINATIVIAPALAASIAGISTNCYLNVRVPRAWVYEHVNEGGITYTKNVNPTRFMYMMHDLNLAYNPFVRSHPYLSQLTFDLIVASLAAIIVGTCVYLWYGYT
jgi:hypothetical protein